MANLFSMAPEPHKSTEAEAFHAERSPFRMVAFALAMIVSADIAIVVAALDALG
jgi:hypothetical protein